MIVIINYGMGNVGSIMNIIKKFTNDVVISASPDMIDRATKLILPGVGSFDNGMKNLEHYNLVEILNDKVLNEKVPVLGICLGMQLLTKKSEEGVLPGLSWIEAETVKFDYEKYKLKIPHMGWNIVNVNKPNKLLDNSSEETRFYFVHSYYVKCQDSDDIILTTKYGIDFASAVNKENIYGVQFHPEKSHKFGLQLLKKFVEI
jgi:imidazole glycerol-phosphate synthase subunit HisH